MISAPAGAASPSPTATIRPLSISTSARREASWFTIVPPRISMLMINRSLHGCIGDRMGPRTGRRLGDHRRLAAATEQGLHRALIVGRLELAGRALGQLV